MDKPRDRASREDISMRSGYWDGWKGICILVVIALHAIPPLQAFPAGSLKWFVDLVLGQFILFPVAIFLGIAGLFSLGRSSESPPETATEYYKRRSMRILPPYLIWTAIFILMEHRTHLSSIKELSKDLLLGTGIGVGYFVIVLIQFVLLTPVLARLDDKRMHIILMAALFACGLLVTYEARVGYPHSAFSEFPFYCLSFVVWYPFYHFGLFVAKFRIVDKTILRRSTAWGYVLYFLFLIASVAEGIFFCRRGDYSLGTSQLKATSLLASFAMFLLLLAYHRVRLGPILANPTLQLLGRSSYLVYLAHLLILHTVDVLLRKVSLIYVHPFRYAFSGFALTSVLCVLAVVLINNLHPRIGKFLGA